MQGGLDAPLEDHMDHVYGEACRPFIRFIIKNHEWVRRQITAARSKFNPKSNEDNKERFYRDTIVTAIVAGKIAEKLGLISFDVGETKLGQAASIICSFLNKKTKLDFKIFPFGVKSNGVEGVMLYSAKGTAAVRVGGKGMNRGPGIVGDLAYFSDASKRTADFVMSSENFPITSKEVIVGPEWICPTFASMEKLAKVSSKT
ncbi:MAG: hypothetical protein S4CHLAM27_10700 [Chlamydiia bacterium]|nr:hypothetical protein [Chlamydiia bacterium]